MTDQELRQAIQGLRDGIRELSGELASAWTSIGKLEERVRELEQDTPQARRLQRELDETLADNAAAGYGEDYGPE